MTDAERNIKAFHKDVEQDRIYRLPIKMMPPRLATESFPSGMGNIIKSRKLIRYVADVIAVNGGNEC